MRFYQVGTWDKDDGKWGKHETVGVVAQSLEVAIGEVRGKKPLTRIDWVTDRGIVHHIVPTEPAS